MRVVRYNSKTQPEKSGLTNAKLYAVEDNVDLVDPDIEKEFGCVTVWDDNGQLNEIDQGYYEFVEGVNWYFVLPKKRFIELL